MTWLVVSTAGCSSLLYYPTRYQYVDITMFIPNPEEQQITLEDKSIIHGWYFHSPQVETKGVVTFFHGNGQNRSAHFAALFWLVREGFDLAIFDYPGYGQSAGDPSPESTVKAASAVIRHIHSTHPQLPLIIYGHSLGGAIAARATWEVRSEVEPRLLVLDSTFLSYKKTARKVMARSAWTWLFQPLSWILFSDRWAPRDRIAELTGTPILVIHSRKDEIIPFELGQEVFERAQSPKEFWVKESGSHNQTYFDAEGIVLKKRLLQKMMEKVEKK